MPAEVAKGNEQIQSNVEAQDSSVGPPGATLVSSLFKAGGGDVGLTGGASTSQLISVSTNDCKEAGSKRRKLTKFESEVTVTNAQIPKQMNFFCIRVI